MSLIYEYVRNNLEQLVIAEVIVGQLQETSFWEDNIVTNQFL